MKIANQAALITGLLLAAQSAFAHDPAMHAAEAAPDCAAMAKMDMSKMDMNDPVMQAMHMKCMPAKKSADNKAAPMDHSRMSGMSHSDMKVPADKAAPDHSTMKGMDGSMSGMGNDMTMSEHGGH